MTQWCPVLAQGLRPGLRTRRNGPEPVEGPLSNHPLQAQKTMYAWLYVLRLKPGKLYIGATTDLDQRCLEHRQGKACRTTRLDPPVALVYSEEFKTNVEARRREAQVKGWSRAKKEALVSGDMSKLRELSKSREDV